MNQEKPFGRKNQDVLASLVKSTTNALLERRNQILAKIDKAEQLGAITKARAAELRRAIS